MLLSAIGFLGVAEIRLSTDNVGSSIAGVPTEEPENKRGNEPLTPIYPFNQPGEAVDLYAGPIGGLFDNAYKGTIRLVPFPTPDLRWQMDVPNAEGYSTMDRVGQEFDLTASEMTGHGRVSSTSFGCVAGISPRLEFKSGVPMERALLHWMNLRATTATRSSATSALMEARRGHPAA